MLTLDQIAARLKDRRLNVLSDKLSLHYNTLQDIRDGTTTNPSLSTVITLSEYFEEQEADNKKD